MAKYFVIFAFTLVLGQINWDIEIIDSTNTNYAWVGRWNSLQVDDSLQPHIVYFHMVTNVCNKIIYAVKRNGNWMKETVDSVAYPQYLCGVSLHLDNNNLPCLSYLKTSLAMPYMTYLHFGKRVNGVWNIQTIDSTPVQIIGFTSLAIDTNNYPSVAYTFKSLSDTLRYIRCLFWNGISWNTTSIRDTSQFSEFITPALKIDERNQTHIAFYGILRSNSGFISARYYTYEDTNWIYKWSDTTSSYNYPAKDIDLALNKSGYPHIAYAWGPLFWATFDGVGWIIEQPPYGVAEETIALDLDTLGLPHIIGARGIACAYYYYRDSIGWHNPISLDPNPQAQVDKEVSLILDSTGHPNVSYRTLENGMCYMKYSRGTFVGIEEKNTESTKLDTGLKMEIYPSVVHSVLNVDYMIPKPGDVEVIVYDVTGSVMKSKILLHQHTGYYKEVINSEGLSNGIYFLILKQNDEQVARKFLLIK
ncbi:MAG: T9SS type A sorting domain-containing protein [bacterium]